MNRGKIMNVLCLVSISTMRDCFVNKPERVVKIEQRLNSLFSDLQENDSYPGSFNLNQNWFETHTKLRTSFGLMDFVELSLEDSIWLNRMYMSRDIDINVSYVYNYNTDDVSYSPHETFPEREGLTTEPEDEDRVRQFHEELLKLYG